MIASLIFGVAGLNALTGLLCLECVREVESLSEPSKGTGAQADMARETLAYLEAKGEPSGSWVDDDPDGRVLWWMRGRQR